MRIPPLRRTHTTKDTECWVRVRLLVHPVLLKIIHGAHARLMYLFHHSRARRREGHAIDSAREPATMRRDSGVRTLRLLHPRRAPLPLRLHG
jgi:hypothetical protein